MAYCDGSCHCTPIAIDLNGTGFQLTDVAGGVRFRVDQSGKEMSMAWTDPKGGNGWLWLDRNGNGMPDDFTELFGSGTEQPKTNGQPNGYLALAVYDLKSHGGNGDGIIDARDQIYNKLSVWTDTNQDGIAQKYELHSLAELKITGIGLKYRLLEKDDGKGNILWLAADVSKVNGNIVKSCDVQLSVDTSKN